MVQPVTDALLLQQLEASPDQAGSLTPVDAGTAKMLDAGGAQLPWYSRLGTGALDPLVAGTQLAAHLLPGMPASEPGYFNPTPQTIQPEQIDKAVQQREQQYQAERAIAGQNGTDWWRIGGNVAATAPLGYLMPGAGATSLLGRVGSGALSGAGSGLLEPVTAGDFWNQKARQAAIGGASGGAAAPVLGALSRVIQPNVSPEVQTLLSAGVRPTPGQILGGAANRVEQGLTSVPGLGDFIKNARRDAVVQFDRGAINQALAPIGETLEAPGIGRDAIAEMQQKIGAAYDKLTPSLGISAVDPATGAASAAATQLNADIGKIMSASAFMPADRAAQLQGIIQRNIYDKMSPAGGMTGESFQEAKSELGRLASEYIHSSSADERQLGGALLQAGVSLRDALRTANPQAASQLAAADNAFAHMLRVQNAASRVGGEPGIFSPAQLQSATRSLDPTLRKRAFAAGDALMQDYAEAGKSALGNTVPDSGTPYRHALELGIAALAGHGLGMPAEYALGAGALTGLAGLGYSPMGRALAARALTSRPSFAAPAAGLLRSTAPGVSAGLPGLLAGF